MPGSSWSSAPLCASSHCAGREGGEGGGSRAVARGQKEGGECTQDRAWRRRRWQRWTHLLDGASEARLLEEREREPVALVELRLGGGHAAPAQAHHDGVSTSATASRTSSRPSRLLHPHPRPSPPPLIPTRRLPPAAPCHRPPRVDPPTAHTGAARHVPAGRVPPRAQAPHGDAARRWPHDRPPAQPPAPL